jgi:hypothetical protein
MGISANKMTSYNYPRVHPSRNTVNPVDCSLVDSAPPQQA